MEKLRTLNPLLEMTKEAERLALEGELMERITTLVVEIRRKAQQEHETIRGDQGRRESPNPTRYELCNPVSDSTIVVNFQPTSMTPWL